MCDTSAAADFKAATTIDSALAQPPEPATTRTVIASTSCIEKTTTKWTLCSVQTISGDSINDNTIDIEPIAIEGNLK